MDLYSVLQLPRDCSKDDIKKAFRSKAVQHHPDRHAHASKSEQDFHAKCFRDANEANEILSSDLKRQVYNRSGRTAASKATTANTSARGGYGYSAGYSAGRQSAGGGFGGRSTYTGYGYAGGASQNSRQYNRQPRRGLWDVFRMVTARSSRGDAVFHAILAGCLVGATLFGGYFGTSLWQLNNRGKSFEDVQRDVQQRAALRRSHQEAHQSAASLNHPAAAAVVSRPGAAAVVGHPGAAAVVQRHAERRQRQTKQHVSGSQPMQSGGTVEDGGNAMRSLLRAEPGLPIADAGVQCGGKVENDGIVTQSVQEAVDAAA